MPRESTKLVAEVLYWVLAPVVVWLICNLHPVVIGVIMAGYIVLGHALGLVSGDGPRAKKPARQQTDEASPSSRMDLGPKLVATIFIWALSAGMVALVVWEPMIVWGEKAVRPFAVCLGVLALIATGLIWLGKLGE
jgi:hypothetical protein